MTRSCIRKRKPDGSLVWRDVDNNAILASTEPGEGQPDGPCHVNFYVKPYKGNYGYFGDRGRAKINVERFLMRCGYTLTN